ncbi:hypothetical protein BaRGS_00028524 [Batillaria attramentaria]|uniref:C2H2-type domain-containing protein n=1 Tax=Batillaria attramentaria TaxID=370345 RepID=A0ABD0JZL7_9CAEN
MLRLHAFKAGTEPLLCDLCGTVLTSQLELNEHQKRPTHLLQRRPVLLRRSEVQAMTDHVSAQHAVESAQTLGVRPVRSSYRQKHLLVLHERSVHAKEKAFACIVAGGRSLNRSRWIGHMNMHTGVRPYPCDQCGRSFKRGEHLKQHRRLHSGGETLFSVACAMQRLLR